MKMHRVPLRQADRPVNQLHAYERGDVRLQRFFDTTRAAEHLRCYESKVSMPTARTRST
jgi:hypothetical protein